MNTLPAEPAICPACGELIIIWGIGSFSTGLVIPTHTDAVTPWAECAASAHVLLDGKILQD